VVKFVRKKQREEKRIMKRNVRGMRRLPAAAAVLALASSGWAQSQIEPKAGTWKTWVISSGKDFRVPPPPNAAATKAELDWVRGAVAEKNPDIAASVAFWDAGSPGYRWIDLMTNRILAGANITPFPHRVYTYLATAMYDATIAAWDSKYAYNRPRPSEVDPTLKTKLPTPQSPSYPSEHAATAAAAAAVLSYFFPNEAASFQTMAEIAGKSRLYAGLQFPSDYFAGMDLGRQVAARVIERAKTDGADIPWAGTVPTGACKWVGANPVGVTYPAWTPFLLASASEFRPPPPPACDSPAVQADLAEIKGISRSPATNFGVVQRSVFWQSLEGINFFHYTYANKWIFEDKLDQNPPRAARVYALVANVLYDGFIANHEAKYTYWYIRPSQLDPTIVPSIALPNHPSYPSNHAALTTARMDVLAYLFPQHADEAHAIEIESGESRVWGGIHYRMDLNAGYPLGRSVAQKFIDWASRDGSQ
jgi:membrane-associated phospholipid phosphatase